MPVSTHMKKLAVGTAITTIAMMTMSAMQAHAGGFGVQEQSAYYLGTSFAGASAGGGQSISSMWWNPATISQAPAGFTVEGVMNWIDGKAVVTPTSASGPALAGSPNITGLGGTGDEFIDTLVPAGYASWRPAGSALSFGLSINAPYGFTTNPHTTWAGQFYARESKVFSLNAAPQVAYQVNDWLSVGGGLQIEYFRVRLESAFPGAVGNDTLSLNGSSTDVGFTAGIALTPTPWTHIGLGYRSQVKHGLEGDIVRPAFLFPGVGLIPALGGHLNTTVTTPDSVNLSIRQKVTESLTLLGTVEWTHWSVLGTLPITYTTAVPAGTVPTQLAFNWQDGWYGAFGAEYQVNQALAVRAGVAWERSPVTDAVRDTRLPDSDRTWVSAGLTYNWSPRLSFDLGYAHIFFKDAPINISATGSSPQFNPVQLGSFTGSADSAADIFSVGLRYRFSSDPVPGLITKG